MSRHAANRHRGVEFSSPGGGCEPVPGRVGLGLVGVCWVGLGLFGLSFCWIGLIEVGLGWLGLGGVGFGSGGMAPVQRRSALRRQRALCSARASIGPAADRDARRICHPLANLQSSVGSSPCEGARRGPNVPAARAKLPQRCRAAAAACRAGQRRWRGTRHVTPAAPSGLLPMGDQWAPNPMGYRQIN